MPLKNFVMKIAGKDPDGNVKGISVNEDGVINTQINNRNVEEVVYHDLEIRDTNSVTLSRDIKKFKKIYLVVEQKLDSEVNVMVRPYIAGDVQFWNGEAWIQDYDADIPARNNTRFLMNTRFNWLNDIVADRLSVRIQPKSTPTEGSIKITLYGVIN